MNNIKERKKATCYKQYLCHMYIYTSGYCMVVCVFFLFGIFCCLISARSNSTYCTVLSSPKTKQHPTQTRPDNFFFVSFCCVFHTQ